MNKPTNAGLPSESVAESLAAIEAAASFNNAAPASVDHADADAPCNAPDGARQCTGHQVGGLLSIARRIWIVTALSAVIVRSRSRCSDGSCAYSSSIVPAPIRAPMHSPINPRNAARCERTTDTSVSFVDGDNDSPGW